MRAEGHCAEDVVQEAFLSLWRSGARYDRAARERAFVGARAWSTTGRSTSSGGNRSAPVRTSTTKGIVERMPAPADTAGEVQSREDATEVRTALNDLPATSVR